MIQESRDFFEFACSGHDEVWTDGAPGIAISDPEEGVVYSDAKGWATIWTRYVRQRLNEGWRFDDTGALIPPHPNQPSIPYKP